MEFISFNNELGIANLLFQRNFQNIRIERTDRSGNKSWLRVPCVYGQRSRIIKSLDNPERKGNYKVPLICFNRTGYSRAGDRLNNLHNEVKFEITSKNRNYGLLTPIPIDINYELVVIAKYQADIDKIASNFMVFFNNDIFVSCEHPKYKGIKLNNQIVMADSISEDHSSELDPTADDLITTTFNFTFKTFLFGGTTQAHRKENDISTYMTTMTSSVVYEFQSDDEVIDFLKNKTHANLSTIVETEITAIMSVEISSDLSDIYDDGIPIIKSINAGFYAVPTPEDFKPWMESVDNEEIAEHEHYQLPSYISSESYIPIYKQIVDDEGNIKNVISQLSTVNDYYEPVDTWCTLAPYVDRLYWKIDENSTYTFPNNVTVANGCYVYGPL